MAFVWENPQKLPFSFQLNKQAAISAKYLHLSQSVCSFWLQVKKLSNKHERTCVFCDATVSTHPQRLVFVRRVMDKAWWWGAGGSMQKLVYNSSRGWGEHASALHYLINTHTHNSWCNNMYEAAGKTIWRQSRKEWLHGWVSQWHSRGDCFGVGSRSLILKGEPRRRSNIQSNLYQIWLANSFS